MREANTFDFSLLILLAIIWGSSFFNIKLAKSKCNKEQKVIKIPNTNVFQIVAPLLLSRGISRIVSEEELITI